MWTKDKHTTACKPITACCLFLKWSFIGAQRHPFVMPLLLSHYKGRDEWSQRRRDCLAHKVEYFKALDEDSENHPEPLPAKDLV